MAVKAAIINFKGGVGKTTLAFHLAAHLASNNKVLLVDLDHQSSLSLVMLGATLWAQRSANGHTTNRIFEAFCNRRVPTPGPEIIFKNPLGTRSPHSNFYPTLDLVPAQFELDDTEIELASTTLGGSTVSEWTKRTLVAEWLDKVGADQAYDYVLFDCPPATKLVSQNALAASSYFVVPVIPDDLSTRGVTHFLNLVTNRIDKKLEYLRTAAPISTQDVPKSYVPATTLAAIVPFMAKSAGRAASGMTNLHTQQIRTLTRMWPGHVLTPAVKHLTGVPESMTFGWPVWNVQGQTANISGAVVRMMRTMCDKVAQRLVP